MIAARAQQLIALIDRRASLRAHVDQLDAFQARQQKLQLLLSGLQPLAVAVATLRQRSVADVAMDDRLPGLVSQWERLRGVFEGDRNAFVDAQRSGFPEFERVCTAFCNELDSRIRQAWRSYTAQRMPSVDPEVLGVLGAIPAYAEPVRRLRDLDRHLTDLRQALPGPAVCQRFEAAVEESLRIWEDLRGGDFSPEILRFLRAASTGGAPLDLLTDSVRRWLASHELQSSFRITMASRFN